jgi:hypothetical protein
LRVKKGEREEGGENIVRKTSTVKGPMEVSSVTSGGPPSALILSSGRGGRTGEEQAEVDCGDERRYCVRGGEYQWQWKHFN